jgi:hypothetical protein
MPFSEPGAAATARTARFDWRAATRGANLSDVSTRAFGCPMAARMAGGTISSGARMAFCAGAGAISKAAIGTAQPMAFKTAREYLAVRLTMRLFHLISVEMPNYPKHQLRFGAAAPRHAIKTPRPQ